MNTENKDASRPMFSRPTGKNRTAFDWKLRFCGKIQLDFILQGKWECTSTFTTSNRSSITVPTCLCCKTSKRSSTMNSSRSSLTSWSTPSNARTCLMTSSSKSGTKVRNCFNVEINFDVTFWSELVWYCRLHSVADVQLTGSDVATVEGARRSPLGADLPQSHRHSEVSLQHWSAKGRVARESLAWRNRCRHQRVRTHNSSPI